MHLARSHRQAYRVSRAERLRRRLLSVRRHPVRTAIVAVLAAAIGVGVAMGPGGRSASRHGWQSGGLVAVPGEPAGTCATAYGPSSYRLDGDQWIVCGRGSGHRCYLQRMHPLDLEAQPVRPTAFDDSCRAALAVLRTAGIVR